MSYSPSLFIDKRTVPITTAEGRFRLLTFLVLDSVKRLKVQEPMQGTDVNLCNCWWMTQKALEWLLKYPETMFCTPAVEKFRFMMGFGCSFIMQRPPLWRKCELVQTIPGPVCDCRWVREVEESIVINYVTVTRRNLHVDFVLFCQPCQLERVAFAGFAPERFNGGGTGNEYYDTQSRMFANARPMAVDVDLEWPTLPTPSMTIVRVEED